MLPFDECKNILKGRLNAHRYEHSLGVVESALMLAKRFGVDEEKTRYAALLHDCAREYPTDEMINEAHRRGIRIDRVEESMPLLLHAPLGAARAAEVYEVRDIAIEQAISSHTVGRPLMSPLEKIIYFADMIEPGRDYDGVEELRELSRTATLDEMMLAGLSQSIMFVLSKGGLIHPSTVEARNRILSDAKGR
ncbi:MAG: bis(5'-nucleosyl)-tetraphosphatase (symmetrical) YqeK [Schwartzia sp.]|nr:bis(5'-nucleosyl)-tetraphosphatase (symmetrical) YqeK [Schwartzia sp. (in: firmicutes)]